MVSASSTITPPAAAVPTAAGRAGLGDIDASVRAPIIVFFVFGLLWLLAGTAFALISSVQLHNPGFLNDEAWTTYGRMRPAFLSAMVYGWGFNAAFAIAMWLMARLSGSVLPGGIVAAVGGVFWNLGVAIGIAGILSGDATGYAWLDMPRYVAPLLFVAYAMIGSVTVATFRFGRFRTAYVSQWYLLAALFWFPRFFTIAQAMLLFNSPRAVVQSILQSWYAGNVFGLWLAPVALASIYFFIPKITGRPIRDYRIARMGFWSLGLFASWAGVRLLIGSPVPAWVQAAGAAASLMMLIPAVVVAVNHLGSLSDQFRRLKESPTLAFSAFASLAFVVWCVLTAATSLRSVAGVTQFTLVNLAVVQLEVQAFFSMAAFGAAYYLLPRVAGIGWPSGALIKAHYWATAAGATLAVLCLAIGGWMQGSAINNPEQFPEYMNVVQRTTPYLVGHSLALVLLAVGHLAFAVNVVTLLMKRPTGATATTLLEEPRALEVAQ